MSSTNPYAPPQARVRDPRSDIANAAGRGARLGAALLDGVIGALLVYGPAFVLVAMNGGFDVSDGELSEESALSFGVGALAGLVVFAALNIVFVLRNSQSVGKKIVGIKVARTDGSKASLGRIFWLRNVVNGVLGVIPLYGLIDVLFIFAEDRRCLHDKIADTIVINA